MTTQIERLFGKIAVVNEILSEEDLDSFIRLKEAEEPDAHLSILLVRKGIVTPRQFEAISNVHKQQLAKLNLEAPPDFYDIGELQAPAAKPKAKKKKTPKIQTETGKKPYCDLPKDEKKFLAGGIKAYLGYARESGASDLHISAGSEPFIRLHGRIVYLRQKPLNGGATSRLLMDMLDKEQKQAFEKDWNIDFAYSDPGVGRFRANIYKQRHGLSGCFRVIPEIVRTIDELGLPKSIADFTTHHQGIVLVTGPAGSGKTTTLAALIDIINSSRKDHIISLEEPIEYIHKSKKCNITQREVRTHTRDFHYALRASLREDPDVIVVGEMRDLETISMAITSAETGHLVFGTLHTTNSTRTVDRILDVFPPKEQPQIRAMVSESLRGVVSQQLVPRADGTGRVAAVEILIGTPAVANMIREYKTFQLPSVLQTGKALGMISMDDSLKRFLDEGIITKEEARYRAENPANIA